MTRETCRFGRQSSRRLRTVRQRAGKTAFLGSLLLSTALGGRFLAGTAVQAQTIREDLYVTNGEVNALAPSGDTLYIGGLFNYVGPPTGGGVPVSAANGTPVVGFPGIAGYVFAAVPDGAGGWFVGGSFSSVGGVSRRNLAHILSDNTLGSWDPAPDDAVYALVLRDSTLYAGGAFTSIGGLARNHIAAVRTTDATISDWNPAADGWVKTLALSDYVVYAGGQFHNIGGEARNRIAAIDLTTGDATAWNPNANDDVWTLLISGSAAYVGGAFTSIGGQTRNRIATVEIATGNATAWNPNAGSRVRALALSGSTVYAGGDFATIGGQNRNRLAALSASTGLATAWNPNSNGTVSSIAVNGSIVYTGGDFSTIGGASRSNLAALAASTGLATSWSPAGTNDDVLVVSIQGSNIFVGGLLTSTGGVTRSCLAAINLVTGQPMVWNPNANARVYTLALRGGTVYAGGAFTSIGGQTRNRLAALSASTGLATTWNPNANGDPATVYTLVVSDSTVYVGGYFTEIGGQARNNVAALNTTDGTATAWNPSANDPVMALLATGSTVYLGGIFTEIGGRERRYLAALDVATGSATEWNPVVRGSLYMTNVRALDLSGATLFVGGKFDSINAEPRRSVAAISTVTGETTAWSADLLDSGVRDVLALAHDGQALYVGGQFSGIGGETRANLAAVDLSNAQVSDWQPDPWSHVAALHAGSSGIYAGGGFAYIDGKPQSYLAAFGPSTVAVPYDTPVRPVSLIEEVEPNPSARVATIGFRLPAAERVTLRIFDPAGREVAAVLRNEPCTMGLHRVEFDARGLSNGVYFCCLEGPKIRTSRKLVIVR
jgi:hypothetical protein